MTSHSKQNKSHSHQMGQRGVTRPMEMTHDNEHHSTKTPDQKDELLRKHHDKTLWVYWHLIFLGLWLIATPLTFSFWNGTVSPPGTRTFWLSEPARLACLWANDVICGALLVILGGRALKADRPVSLWLACGVGTWLSFAPLLFWSPSPLVYLNDTFVGMLVIALTILIPGMPNMVRTMEMGAEVPQGWSYNPSSWTQRSILIFLGFAGWIVSRYLAAYQLGYIDHVWDPFFGQGSVTVLTSKISNSLPISDAGLGSYAYTLEFLMAWMGSSARWRTMPWMVALFGILVIPLGLVHIILVISQPLVVGSWCTMCLLAALIMLPMIPLEVDEVVAMIQFMKQAVKKGEPFWKTFWKGGSVEGEMKDQRTPPISSFPDQPVKIIRASFWGMNFPLTLVGTTVLGLWLIFAPLLFQTGQFLSNMGHLLGSLIVTTAVISMGETIRTFRFFLIPLGLTVIAAAFFSTTATMVQLWSFSLPGLLICGLSLPRGPLHEKFGNWDRYIK